MLPKLTINFRKIQKKDLKILRDWRNSKNIFKYNSQYIFLNLIHQKKWFEEICSRNSDRVMFMIILENKPIGVCGLIHADKQNRNADVALILGEEKIHGRGFGFQSLAKLIDYGFKKLGLHRIGADIFEFNTKSIKLFSKLNFNQETTYRKSLWRDGKWWDVYGYSLLRNEYNKN